VQRLALSLPRLNSLNREDVTFEVYVDFWRSLTMKPTDSCSQLAALLEQWTKSGKQMIAADSDVSQPNGWLIFLYENGDKMFQGEWQNGAPHGLTQTWYPNGEPMHEVQFENGYLHGHWRMRNESGRFLVTAFYEFGMKVEWTEWDFDGQVKYEWRAKRT
jgi:antitoxin component YwqK of YwqJK toxin-antitoxin module